METFFEEDFPLEKIKENKIFSFHESIDEILQELMPLINDGKIHVIEENNIIRIKADLPLQKFKNLEFIVKEKKKQKKKKLMNYIILSLNRIKRLKI